MRIKVLLLSLLLVVIGQLTALAQNVVGGVVSDENGDPIIGAQVKVKGSKIGTATDIDGKFTLPSVKSGETLEINYLGMKSVSAKAFGNMKVTLVSEDRQLDEVIVVAYGEQKKSSFTGSAGVVGNEQISKRQVNNVVDALNGQVAGVQMINTSGDPNSTPTIRIRGISSINAGKDPLIVVDGSPYYGSWNDINPADVASITVLKDAASNALYGARGANGVIMITTKRPQQGKTIVTLDAKWGSNSRASQFYETINDPGQYYEAHYAALKNYNLYTLGKSAYEAHVAANNAIGKSQSDGGVGYICYAVPNGQYLIGDNGKLNPNATLGNRIYYNGQVYTIYPDDWRDAAYRTTLRQEYNANVSGGNEASQFYASLGYLNNPGIAYGSDYERYTARLKADYKANEWLKVGGNVNFAHSVSNYATEVDDSGNNSTTNTFYTVNSIAPIYPLYLRDGEGNIMTDDLGKIYDYGDGSNAGLERPFMSQTNELRDDQLQTKQQIANTFGLHGFAEITPKFIDGLKLTLNGSVNDYEYRYTETYQPFYGWGTTTYPEGDVSKSHYRYYTVNFQQLLNYAKSFGKHNMTLLLGHENYKQTYEYVYAERTGMNSYFDNQELSGAITINGASSSQTNYNTEGYFFRGMYDYDGKYFGQVSYRRDASSRFHPDHRWGNFYSFGGAWILTKESWMENTQGWLDMLKIKASFGQQGNDNIGNYRYMDLYNIDNADGQLALTFYSKGNKNITWETNTNVNVGAEFELLKSRIRGSVEYFYRRTTDMLSWISVPMSKGYSGYYDNVGNMVNKGVEFDFTFEPVRTKDLTWSISVNGTHYVNEITSLVADNKNDILDGHAGYTSGRFFYGEGLPIYTYRLKKYAGVNESGQGTWYVTNADGTLGTTTTWSDATYYACGDPTPDLYGGFGSNLSFKGIDFSFNFTYSIGGKSIDYGYQSLMTPPTSSLTGNAMHKDVLKSWTETNTETNIPRYEYNDSYLGATSDRWLTNSSYLSLQNISLGYTLPKTLTSKWGFSKIRVYGSADNVYLWTKRKGFDPRTSFSGTPSNEGYSFVRSISGGITLQF